MKRLLLSIGVALAFAAPMHAADSSEELVNAMVTQAPGLRADVLKLALTSATCAEDEGLVPRRDLLTVIDYSLPSSQPRLFIFDLSTHKLLFRELVAHGKGSGGDIANFFSNSPGSLATSLGLYVTADTYEGGNGYSLRLRGLEEGINDMAWDRAIVMHGASYVSEEAVKALGRAGQHRGQHLGHRDERDVDDHQVRRVGKVGAGDGARVGALDDRHSLI